MKRSDSDLADTLNRLTDAERVELFEFLGKPTREMMEANRMLDTLRASAILHRGKSGEKPN